MSKKDTSHVTYSHESQLVYFTEISQSTMPGHSTDAEEINW